MADKYVQYGCGWSSPDEWQNFDSSPTLFYERIPILGKLYVRNEQRFPENVQYGNIVKGLPIAKESCDGLYCSHVLEHLALDELRIALRNSYNLLKKGGVFRLVLPDMKIMAKRYLEKNDRDACMAFIRDIHMGEENRPRGFFSFLKSWFGASRHLWMWDFESLSLELENAGFTDIRRAYFNDSKDQKYKYVEAEDRWTDALGIECKRS